MIDRDAIARTVAGLSADIANHSVRIGNRVVVRADVCTERARLLSLSPPGILSANRCCRLVRTQDGWIAVNLPREVDLASVPAWIGCAPAADPWPAIVELAQLRMAGELTESAQMLGLAVATIGEVAAQDCRPPLLRMGKRRSNAKRITREFRVLDMSDLWAGPLCGAILAAAGADVIKIDTGRSARSASPEFDERLNGLKREITLDLHTPPDLSALKALLCKSDVVITSARPRAFEQLGLAPSEIFAANPSLVWIAITGYGWQPPNARRVGFGDDAAAAGGLLLWTAGGQPTFCGDAIADPLTGLAAALAAFEAIAEGGGVLIDAALARTAAGVAHGASSPAASAP